MTSIPYLKTENWIIQTGNGSISPVSCPLIKKLLYKIFLNSINEFKAGFKIGKGIISLSSLPLIKQLLLHYVSKFFQWV